MTRGSAYKYLNQVYFSTKNDSYREALSLALSALRAVNAACEAIQVAAMCKKFLEMEGEK